MISRHHMTQIPAHELNFYRTECSQDRRGFDWVLPQVPADVAIYCRVCQQEKGLSQPASDAQLYGWQSRTLDNKEAEAFPAVSTTAVSFRQAVV